MENLGEPSTRERIVNRLSGQMRSWFTLGAIAVLILSVVMGMECAHRGSSASLGRIDSRACGPSLLGERRDQENAAGMLDCAKRLKAAPGVAHREP